MTHLRRGTIAPLAVLVATLALSPSVRAAASDGDPLPANLRDRGAGIPTSMFGTNVRKGELLVYPFAELYADRNFEYKPSELGYGLDMDQRGNFTASEQLLFVSYGITNDLAIEMEGAYISAELAKSRTDASGLPGELEESGLGDVEGQIRWRFAHERGSRPEAFTYFETVLPLQKQRRMIGTSDWEWSLGAGVTRGYRWGTLTLRAGAEYARKDRKFDLGEYALEYQRRLSPAWKACAIVEGSQLDEASLITELQWQLTPRAVLKVNNGWGLTSKATDLAPEAGVMFSF